MPNYLNGILVVAASRELESVPLGFRIVPVRGF